MRLRLMLAALGAALLMPASASAYMTIGPPLTGLSRVAPPCTYGGCSIVHQSHTGNEVTWPVQGNPLDPIHGVIVRWRVVGQGKFQLFPGSYVDSAMNVFRRGKATTIQVGTSNTQPTTFAARTRIAPGQHIGLTLHPGATLAMVNETSTRADSWRPALPFDLPVIAEAGHSLRAGFQAVVEFDRDKDGYGSPSQDACDTDKLTIGACDKPPVPPEPEPDEPAPIPPAPNPPAPNQPAPTPTPVPRTPVPSPTLDRIAPAFAGTASIAPRRFRARQGARLSFTLSEAARVRLSLARRTSRKRYRRVIAVTRELPQGASSIRIGRRVGGKRLRRGRYRATLRAVDAAGNKSAPVRVRFRVR